MFIELVGSTSLAGRLDPEDRRALITSYQSCCASVIGRFEGFARDETLEELVAAIERDIAANKPGRRLIVSNTYRMKRFGHLLDTHQVAWTRAEPLYSRVGKYIKVLEQRYPLRELSRQIAKNAIGVLDRWPVALV